MYLRRNLQIMKKMAVPIFGGSTIQFSFYIRSLAFTVSYTNTRVLYCRVFFVVVYKDKKYSLQKKCDHAHPFTDIYSY